MGAPGGSRVIRPVRLFRPSGAGWQTRPVFFGYVLAVLAAVASGSGPILESAAVRRAGAYGGSPGDLVALRRQPLYFLGLGVDLLGFVSAAVALHRLPLFLVQSVLAFSVGVTASISAVMGVRLAAAAWVALGAGATGLVLLGLSADPSPARPLPLSGRLLLLGAVHPIAAIAFATERWNHHWSAAPVLGFCAGLGFSVVGVSARTLGATGSAWSCWPTGSATVSPPRPSQDSSSPSPARSAPRTTPGHTGNSPRQAGSDPNPVKSELATTIGQR